MPGKLLASVFGVCSHEFSWPRRWSDGHYYQVCLQCGDEWLYDWKNMERKERITAGQFAQRTLREARRPGLRMSHSISKSSWKPRARRVKLENRDLKFRERGERDWQNGTVENISASGVLFRTSAPVRENASIEMILQMPEPISGQREAMVLASCTVVRTAEEGENPAYGAILWEYRFLHAERGSV